MAETVTDRDVVKARERVDRLNQAIADERAKAYAQSKEGENAVRKAQLDVEAERLERELEALRSATKPAVVRTNVDDTVSAVRAGDVEGQPADIVVTAEPGTAAPTAPSVKE